MTLTPEDSTPTWMLNPHYSVIRCNSDEVLLKHSRRSSFSESLTDDMRTGMLANLVELLQEPRTLSSIAELTGMPDDTISSVVTSLQTKGIAIRVDGNSVPPIMYLQMLKPTLDPSSLAEKSICIVGGGLLAARIVNHLATYGVSLAHLSSYEISCYDELRTYGIPASGTRLPEKATTLIKRNLKQLGVTTDYRVVDGLERDTSNLTPLIISSDLTVVALDVFSPALLHTANEIAIREEKPWMFAYLDGSEISIGPIMMPGDGPCYLELAIQQDAALKHRGHSWLYSERMNQVKETTASYLRVVPAHVDIAAGLTASEAIRWAVLRSSALMGRSLHISLETLQFNHANVMRLPRCPACARIRAPYRATFF